MVKKFLVSAFTFSLFFLLFLAKNASAQPLCTSETSPCGQCGYEITTCCTENGTTTCSSSGCIDSPPPSTEQDENWVGYKCETTNCGGKVLKANCTTHYTRNCWCADWRTNTWECTPWECQGTYCENVSIAETCEYWQVCANSGAFLKCNDQKCWMEKNEWKTRPTERCRCDAVEIEGGFFGIGGEKYCKEVFRCDQNNFSSCHPNYFQREQLSCQCWGQCLDPVVEPHYYDGQKELPWKVDCSKFPKKWQREECEILNREGIKLPVKFGWDMPGRWQDYWASSSDSSLDESVWSLKIKIDGKERFLTHTELLNITKFNNPEDQKETKSQKLDRLLKKNCPSIELAYFLSIWDNSLFPILGMIPQKLINACNEKNQGNNQRLNQILYFIYFVEGEDPVGKPGGEAGAFTYSISEDKAEGGPCSLIPNKNYNWEVKLCCEKDHQNCGPPDPIRNSKMDPSQTEKWNFKTHAAPEPVGILEAQVDDWWKGTKKQCFFFWCWDVEVDDFKASAIRWIDTDWNGPNIVILKEKNFIDFEWCKTSQVEGVRAFYKGKILLKEKLPGEEEIEKRKKEGPPECEDPKLPCFCDNQSIDLKIRACLCDKIKKPPGFNFERDCKSIFLENFDICHPNLVKDSEKPRLKWDVMEIFGKRIEDIRKEINQGNEDEIRWEIKKKMEENCAALPTEEVARARLAKNETIYLTEDPYYPLKYGVNFSNATTGEKTVVHPPYNVNNLGGIWGWDFQILPFSLNNEFSWQPSLGIPPEKPEDQIVEFISGQSWNFLLVKKPKDPIMKWSIKDEKLVPAEKITEIKFPSPDVEVSTTTINSSVIPVIHRLPNIYIPYVHRTFSNYLEFFDESGKSISIPKEISILRDRKGKQEEVVKVHQFWLCLKKQDRNKSIDENNPNYYRLDRQFTLKITPCFDEWVEDCIPEMGLTQKLKTTGAKPTFNEADSGPPPPERVRIPRYLNWDSVPGAPSFLLEISGPKSLEKKVTIRESFWWLESQGDGVYKWKVKSCADKCGFPVPLKEELLQCGTSSDEMVFYGCEMNPSQNFSPKLGEQFFPNELNGFSWDVVDCQGPVPIYQFKLEYSVPTNCNTLKKELRDKCNEIQGSEKCKNLLENRTIVPITNVETNSFSLSSPLECLGTYHWQIKACLDEECKEAGNWSPLLYFYVVLEKVKPRGWGVSFGTCKNIIPCTDCKFSDIPKIIANILSCLLWTVSPIAIVFLLLYTGIGIYFSFGDPKIIEKAKSIWKAVGVGFLIMLLSWTIVNLIGKTLKMPGW